MIGKNAKWLYSKLAWVLFFGICMAYLESAVVVYLRELYYPDGFNFPIQFIPVPMAIIELGREAATIFMLLAIAFLTGKNAWTRLAYFMFSFGVWDIWYYIWLKIFLNWPESLFTWDLLFLIPVPWTGPVIAPILVSLSLIAGAIVVLNFESKGFEFKLTRKEWQVLVIAPAVIFISFILEAPKVLRLEAPSVYHWELLFIGEVIGIIILLRAIRRLRRK
ncbi:MAG: hypothetical protein ONB16_09315 [candidate division KSB1 bacterium]|nr:hypothetical protein [candidate division KSB1 bacterium]MDZ7358961.1 hypothetical protein [candidate division KSB1 bacterium]MDZ7402327.1 hypothetical protein [candidate division KSB1 bacterium]